MPQTLDHGLQPLDHALELVGLRGQHGAKLAREEGQERRRVLSGFGKDGARLEAGRQRLDLVWQFALLAMTVTALTLPGGYATAFQASNDQAFKAAEMIAAMAPGDLNKVLFCNSGSEAADTSLKVALAYHRARGEGHRNVFIGREKGYHGVGFGGMSVGGIPANRKVYGTALLPRVDHMRFIHDPANAYIHNQEPESQEDFLAELAAFTVLAWCTLVLQPPWQDVLSKKNDQMIS